MRRVTLGMIVAIVAASAGCSNMTESADAGRDARRFGPGRPDTGPRPDANLDAPFPDANEDAPYYDAPCTLACPRAPLGCDWVRTDFSLCTCGVLFCDDSGPGPDAALRGTDAYVSSDVGGVLCVANGDCASGQFCGDREYCGGAGACRPVPDACPDVEAIVCGCDGREYGNACEAARAGVSVASSGPCLTPGACTSNDACGAGQYCERAYCESGGCRVRPDSCFTVVDPVCGCDGMTYSNACEAARVGVSVRRRGSC
jgi:hypothetical protein